MQFSRAVKLSETAGYANCQVTSPVRKMADCIDDCLKYNDAPGLASPVSLDRPRPNKALTCINYHRIAEFTSLFIYDVWFADQLEAQDILQQQKFANFIYRLSSSIQIAPQLLELAMYYVQFVKNECPDIKQSFGSEYPLLIACLSIACKSMDDNAYSNAVWSRMSGIPLLVLNQVERQILLCIDYTVHVSPTAFEKWRIYLKNY